MRKIAKSFKKMFLKRKRGDEEERKTKIKDKATKKLKVLKTVSLNQNCLTFNKIFKKTHN